METAKKVRILVGSINPVKIEAVREAFLHYFRDIEIVEISVESGVSAQPIGDETFKGAENRALLLMEYNKRNRLNADFMVGIEGGLLKASSKWFQCGCICILDNRHRKGFGVSPLFELPRFVVEKLLNGVELGDVIDAVTGDHNSKQKSGAIGFLTRNVMDRKVLYKYGVIAAMVPFLNEKLFFDLRQE